jgi:hypothetical protein
MNWSKTFTLAAILVLLASCGNNEGTAEKAGKAIDSAGENAAEKTGDMIDSMTSEGLVDDTVSAMKDSTSEMMSDAKNKTSDALSDAKASGKEMITDAKSSAEAYSQTLKEKATKEAEEALSKD